MSGEFLDFQSALGAGYASYDDRNTLWMHTQGRITLNPEDLQRLEEEAAFKENLASQAGGHAALGDLAVVAATNEVDPGVATFMRAQELVDEKMRATPSSDPRRKVEPWGSDDKATLINEGATSAVDLWDGNSSTHWDTQIRSLHEADSLLPVIQITRLEHWGTWNSPIPTLGAPRDMYVRYTLTAAGCTAASQDVQVKVKPENRWRLAKTTVKETGGFSGNYPVSDVVLDKLLEKIDTLTPRAGRVWPDLS
ncbi:MAG TPA: hypothetical protein VLE73_04680 [Candidatus Saccharimonadales bacterium]|nr:hypothetical protein [Candidatus Saccharimonadales bacterium]